MMRTCQEPVKAVYKPCKLKSGAARTDSVTALHTFLSVRPLWQRNVENVERLETGTLRPAAEPDMRRRRC